MPLRVSVLPSATPPRSPAVTTGPAAKRIVERSLQRAVHDVDHPSRPDTAPPAEAPVRDEISVHGEPEIHGGDLSDAVADFAERDLAAELAGVLARKPRRTEPVSTPPAGDEDTQAEPETTARLPPTGRRAFVSALRHEPSAVLRSSMDNAGASDAGTFEPDDCSDPDAGTPLWHAPSAWMTSAKHRNLRSTLRETGAWLATIAIGTTIVVVAAILLFEGPSGLAAWLHLGHRTL